MQKNHENIIYSLAGEEVNPQREWIVNESNKAIRKPSLPVKLPLTAAQQKVVDQMVAYVDATYEDKAESLNLRPGIGVAAPQMGLNAQIIYIHLNENEVEHRLLLANPEIVGESEQLCYIEGGEGCLSVDKDYENPVPRKFRIFVKAYDLLAKKEVTIEASALLAVCLQHEVDHLSGKLFYDRAVVQAAPDWIIIRR